MQRAYDLFERLGNGAPVWRGYADGLEATVQKLREIARRTNNECFAMSLPSKEVVALENIPKAKSQRPKRVIYQIAYDERLLLERSELLSSRGYRVVSLLGNEPAQIVLSSPRACDLFIVGHNASEETRKEMVAWLKRNYPEVPVLDLHPPKSVKISSADFNAEISGPDVWLSVVATAVA